MCSFGDNEMSQYFRCICEALKNKTRILVTHQLHLLEHVDMIHIIKNVIMLTLYYFDVDFFLNHVSL